MDAQAEGKGQRLMLGTEALCLQGFPLSWLQAAPHAATEPQRKDLAGNACSATVFGSIYVALLSRVRQYSTSSEPDMGLDQLASLMS